MIRALVIVTLLFGASCGAAVAPRSGQVASGPLPPPASCEGEAECTMECDRDIATSCTHLAVLIVRTTAIPDLPDARDAMNRTLALFEKACTLKDGRACVELGDLYAGTKSAPPSTSLNYYAKALALFREACDRGDARGCFHLGKLHVAGKAVPKDPAAVAKLYAGACSAERYAPEACGALSAMYGLGAGVAQDRGKAYELAKRGCDGGDGKACMHQGLLLFTGQGVAKNEAASLLLLLKSCDLGEGGGCGMAAAAYLRGEGVAKDERRAAELFDRGCELRDTRSCVVVGAYYEHGRFLPKDPTKAVKAYDLGCRKHPEACVNLGRMYDKGEGVAKDPGKALALFEGACNAKVQPGCTWVGVAVLEDDPARAKRLFEESCTANDSMACYMLALGYDLAWPQWPADPSAAKLFLEKSCKLGGRKACLKAGLPQPSP